MSRPASYRTTNYRATCECGCSWPNRDEPESDPVILKRKILKHQREECPTSRVYLEREISTSWEPLR